MFEEDEIDLLELAYALLEKWVAILATTIFGGAVALLFTIYCVTPMYRSSISFYVNNSSVSIGGTKVSISSGDLSAAQDLVSTYIVILNTRNTMNEIIKDANVDYSYGQLSSMVTAGAVNNTQIFKVTVESSDPVEAQTIAKSIGKVLPNKITSIIDGCSARVVDNPVVAGSPSSPNVRKNVLTGAMAGFALACAIVVIRHLLNDIIVSEDDIIKSFDLPVLASIPNLTIKSSDSDSYIYGNYGEKPDNDILDALGSEDKNEGGAN